MNSYTQSDFSTGINADQLAASLKAAKQEQDASKEQGTLVAELKMTREEVKSVNDSVKEANTSVKTLISTVTKTGKDIDNGYKVIIPPETIEHQIQVLDTFEKEFDAMIEKKMEEVATKMKDDNKAFFKGLDRNRRQIVNATNKVFISPLMAWWIGTNFVMLIIYFALNMYLSYGKFPVQKYVELCHNFKYFFIATNILILLYHLWEKEVASRSRY